MAIRRPNARVVGPARILQAMPDRHDRVPVSTRITRRLHRRLKARAVQSDQSLQAVIETMLVAGLKEAR